MITREKKITSQFMGIWSRHWIDKLLHFNNIVAQYSFQQIRQCYTCWDLFYNRRHILTKLTSFFKRKLEKNKTSNIFYDPDKHFWSNIFLCYFLIVTNFIQLKFHFFKFIFFLTWIIFKLPYEIYIYIFSNLMTGREIELFTESLFECNSALLSYFYEQLITIVRRGV